VLHDAVRGDRLVVPEALHVECGKTQRGGNDGERSHDHQLAVDGHRPQPCHATRR